MMTGVKNEPTFPQTLLKNCNHDCGNFPINDDGLPDGVRVVAPEKTDVSAQNNRKLVKIDKKWIYFG